MKDERAHARRTCPGFGDNEGQCKNLPGSARTPVWCADCDEKRMAHLGKRFAELRKSYGLPPSDN